MEFAFAVNGDAKRAVMLTADERKRVFGAVRELSFSWGPYRFPKMTERNRQLIEIARKDIEARKAVQERGDLGVMEIERLKLDIDAVQHAVSLIEIGAATSG